MIESLCNLDLVKPLIEGMIAFDRPEK